MTGYPSFLHHAETVISIYRCSEHRDGVSGEGALLTLGFLVHVRGISRMTQRRVDDMLHARFDRLRDRVPGLLGFVPAGFGTVEAV